MGSGDSVDEALIFIYEVVVEFLEIIFYVLKEMAGFGFDVLKLMFSAVSGKWFK